MYYYLYNLIVIIFTHRTLLTTPRSLSTWRVSTSSTWPLRSSSSRSSWTSSRRSWRILIRRRSRVTCITGFWCGSTRYSRYKRITRTWIIVSFLCLRLTRKFFGLDYKTLSQIQWILTFYETYIFQTISQKTVDINVEMHAIQN